MKTVVPSFPLMSLYACTLALSLACGSARDSAATAAAGAGGAGGTRPAAGAPGVGGSGASGTSGFAGAGALASGSAGTAAETGGAMAGTGGATSAAGAASGANGGGAGGGSPRAEPCTETVQPGEDIQAAVERVVALGGGVVCLPAGTWTLTSTLTLGSNITLRGAGSKTLIQGPSTVYDWPLINVTTPAALSNVTVSDMTIDGRIPRSAAFDPNSGYQDSMGIFFFASSRTGSNLAISGVEVRNTSEALHAKGFDGVTVSNCYFHDNGIMLSPTLGNHNFYLYWDTNVTISNVRSIGSWAGDGLHLRDITGTTTVKDSTFVGNYRLGIHAQLSGNTTTNTVIANNDISYNGSEVVVLSSYDGRNMNGLDLETVTGSVTANVAVGNTGCGLLSRDGTGNMSGNIALGNRANPQIDSYAGLILDNNSTLGAFSDGAFTLRSRQSGLVLAGGGPDGAAIVQTAPTGVATQKWNLVSIGNDEYTLTNAASQLVLSASGDTSTSGAAVVTTSAAARDDQAWRVIPASPGYYRLCVKSAPGICLDGTELAIDGSAASVTPYGSSGHEQWQLEPL